MIEPTYSLLLKCFPDFWKKSIQQMHQIINLHGYWLKSILVTQDQWKAIV